MSLPAFLRAGRAGKFPFASTDPTNNLVSIGKASGITINTQVDFLAKRFVFFCCGAGWESSPQTQTLAPAGR